MKRVLNTALLLAIGVCISSCANNTNDSVMNMTTYKKDKAFLEKYIELIELRDGDKRVLLTPDYQGRVLTSSANGLDGDSFGWINRDLIESEQKLPHVNNYGGEDRMWLGPEGGQFSIYFPSPDDFSFEKWQVPSIIDTDKWQVLSSSDQLAAFGTTTSFTNASGTTFNCRLERNVKLISDEQIAQVVGVDMPEGASAVGFSSLSRVTNIGTEEWTKQSGALSIWILGQFISSSDNNVVIPTKGDTGLVDDYFGKVPEDRLIEKDGVFYFKADGRMRGKIGVLRDAALPKSFALDKKNGLLTVITYSIDPNAVDYVNSRWAHQDDPFNGDVINAYNDGPLEDGTIMGGFYEIESSSQALFLKGGETFEHTHTTIHIQADVEELERMLNEMIAQLM